MVGRPPKRRYNPKHRCVHCTKFVRHGTDTCASCARTDVGTSSSAHTTIASEESLEQCISYYAGQQHESTGPQQVSVQDDDSQSTNGSHTSAASKETTSRLTRSRTRAAMESTRQNTVTTTTPVTGADTKNQKSRNTITNQSIPPPVEHREHYAAAMWCKNCHRRRVQLRTIERENISFARKFCLFTAGSVGDDAYCYVCHDCYEVIIKGKKNNKSDENRAWPAFVWSVLRDRASRIAYGDEVWRLLPSDWRIWWIEAFTTLWIGAQVTLELPIPFFNNVTREKDILDGAIAELRWNELTKAVDDYGFIPFVKCPFGCSEFYNMAKYIELDVVFGAFVKKRENNLWISPRKKLSKMSGARPDYFGSAHAILENPNWICSPAIYVSAQDGAKVLTCQFHGGGSNLRYIHIPTNPTGTIMTDGTDQCVPAVVIPKTVKSAKARQYSNSYHMSKMGGTYEGVDSIVLADKGRFNINNRLSDLRDSFTFVARPDVVSHVHNMVSDNVISMWLAKSKLDEAKRLFPNGSIEAIQTRHCRGATFVTLEDAIEMERTMKLDREVTVRNNNGREVSFTPSWPRSLSWVHPYDGFGAEFYAIPKMASKGSFHFQSLWIVTAIVVSIAEIWKLLVDNTTKTSDWYGSILQYATNNCINARYYVKGSRNNPFREKLGHHKLSDKFEMEFNNGEYEPGFLKDVFIHLHEHVLVLTMDELLDITMETITHDMVILYNDHANNECNTCLELSDIQAHIGNQWELRMVLCTRRTQNDWDATFFCRHGKDHFPNWWKHERGKMRVVQHGPTLPPNALKQWDACVYIRLWKKDMDDVRANYISSCGGQSKLWCYQHNNVLVDAPQKQNLKCCFCIYACRYTCPNRNCPISVCNDHFTDWIASDPRPRMFLNHNGVVGNHHHQCSNSITSSTRTEIIGVDDHDGNLQPVDKDIDNQSTSTNAADLKDCASEMESFLDAIQDHFDDDHHVNNSQSLLNKNESCGGDQAVHLLQWDTHEACIATTGDNSNEDAPTEDDSDDGLVRVDGDDPFLADFFEHVEQDVLDASYVEGVHSSVDEQLLSSSSSSSSWLGSNVLKHISIGGTIIESNGATMESWSLPPLENCGEGAAAIDPAGLITHGNCFANYYELVDDVDCNVMPGDDEGNEYNFPTTNSGRDYLPVHLEKQHAVGLSVLLNKYGRLLVRKKRKLNPTSFERFFLQGLVSQSKSNSIPLLFPEAMLFPSLFPFSAPDGSSVGAIPSALLRDHYALHRLGFASLQDHCRTRMMDTALLTSTDYRYQFMTMDMMANLNMRGHDTRIMLSRGFAHAQGDIGIQASFNEHNVPFESDSVDSRSNVNKLAAALGEQKGTYFFTHTCNQKAHFGVRKIKEWLDSDEAVVAVMKRIYGANTTFGSFELEETRKQLIQSSCAVTTRCWINVVNIYMRYITKSPERPIGAVTKSWYRLELQESEANLPHVHAILWLAEDDGSQHGQDKVLHRIRASIRDMVTTDERLECINNGYVSSMNELDKLLEELSRILRHKHDRRCLIPAFIRRTSTPGGTNSSSSEMRSHINSSDLFFNGHYRCKVPDNHKLSPNFEKHCFVEIDVQHTEAASSILSAIGLARLLPNGKLQFLEESLVMKRHIPPTVPLEGIISPVAYPLIIMNPNSNNVQYLDSVCVSRYLAKYVASIDEGNRVYLEAPTEANKSLNVQFDCTGNTKISSVAISDNDKKDKSNRRHVHHRLVSQPENVMYQLGIPQIYTDIEFIHVPTVPLEERPAFDREAPLERLVRNGLQVTQPINSHADLDSNAVIPSHIARMQFQGREAFPPWRHFKPAALDTAKDQLLSPLTLDGLSIFGMRPPELYFVKRQELYLKCFTFEAIKGVKRNQGQEIDNLVFACKEKLSSLYERCGWIDARSKVVKLRLAGIPVLWDYIEKSPVSYFGGSAGGAAEVKRLFQLFMLYFSNHHNVHRPRTRSFTDAQEQQKNYLKEKFLCQYDKRFLPVTWFTNIKPVHPSRFLIHALLSMGEFDNEAELMSEASIKNAYIHARLFDPSSPQDSINKLTKRYVMEQLRNLPGGTPQFDRFLEAAHNVFKGALMHDEIIADGLPPFLYTHLKAAATEQVNKHIQASFETVARVARSILDNAKFQNLPSLEQLLSRRWQRDSSTTTWNATDVAIGTNQPEQSFIEQAQAIKIGVMSINQYMDTRSPYTPKCVCVVGDPGAGKTTVLTLLVMHALSHGLNVGVTAIMSERALQLGGRHLHYLFCLPVREGKISVAKAANLAISKLLNQPWKLHFLLSLDILAIDELGQISAELIAILDIILRRIRKCTRFMGGILVLSTMDVMQLLPITGRPPMTSPHMMTSFKFARLRHSVRAATDTAWQRVQQISRFLPTELTDDIINEFKNLIMQHCTFVDSFDDPVIPQSALLVFGRKNARDAAIKNRIEVFKQHGTCSIRTAEDEVRSFDGEWREATSSESQRLNKECKEPFELYFYPRALYEITFNKENHFSQSQLAVLIGEPPTPDDLAKFRPVRLLVAPPGNKIPPPDDATVEYLLMNGWTYERIGKAPEDILHSCGGIGMKGKRTQYGLRPRIAATIHSIMGQDVPCLVTKIDHSHQDYNLWEHEQVVVLLSRTPTAKSTIFVGNPSTVADTLTFTLMRMTQFTRYICHLLDAFTNSSHRSDCAPDPFAPSELCLEMHPYRPIDVPLPQDDTGCAYLLVSCQNTSVTYIGETSCLPYRLDSHNSGFGSSQTQSVLLRPWAVLAFVVGFDGDSSLRKAFESQWKSARENEWTRLKRSLLADEVANLGLKVISERLKKHPEEVLRFVRAGFIATIPPAPTSGDGLTTDTAFYNHGEQHVCHDESFSTNLPPCSSLQEPVAPPTMSFDNSTTVPPPGNPTISITSDAEDSSSVEFVCSVPHTISPQQEQSVAVSTTRRRASSSNRRPHRENSSTVPLHYLIRDVDRWLHSFGVDKSCLQMLRPNAFVSCQVLDLFAILACQESVLVEYALSTYYGQFLDSRRNLSNPYPRTHSPEHDQYLCEKPLWVTFLNVGGHHWQTLAIVNPRSRNRFAILMDSLVDPLHLPRNIDDAAEFAGVFIRDVFRFDNHRHCIPPVIVAFVPHQGTTCDCAIFSLLNLNHVLQRAQDFLDMRTPCTSTSPLDFRSWYEPSPEGHGYRQTLYNQFEGFCNLTSSSFALTDTVQHNLTASPTISAQPKWRQRGPIPNDASIIDLAGQQRRRTKTNDNNHAVTPPTRPQIVPSRWFVLNEVLPDYDLWGNFDEDPIELIRSTDLAPQQTLGSFVVDMFGIRLCHNHPSVQFLRSSMYGYATLFVGSGNKTFIDLPRMKSKLRNASAWIAPINQDGYHWQLLLLLHPGTMHCTFLLFDSLNNPGVVLPSNSASVKSMCWQILREVFHPRVAAPVQHPCVVPRQQNGFDCGVLTLSNMEKVLTNLSFFLDSFSPSSPPLPTLNFIHWYDATKEGIRQRLQLFTDFNNLADQHSTYSPPGG